MSRSCSDFEVTSAMKETVSLALHRGHSVDVTWSVGSLMSVGWKLSASRLNSRRNTCSLKEKTTKRKHTHTHTKKANTDSCDAFMKLTTWDSAGAYHKQKFNMYTNKKENYKGLNTYLSTTSLAVKIEGAIFLIFHGIHHIITKEKHAILPRKKNVSSYKIKWIKS